MEAAEQIRANRLCEDLLLREQRCLLLIPALLHRMTERSEGHDLLDQIGEGSRQRAQQLHACLLEWGGQPRSLSDQDQPDGEAPEWTLGDLRDELQALRDGYCRLELVKNWAGSVVRQLDETLGCLPDLEAR